MSDLRWTEVLVPSVHQDLLTNDLEMGGLDGQHHLWCKTCHPDWEASVIGPGVGNPFTAWCGTRAVILACWPTDDLPPGACNLCNDPARPCSTCGAIA